MHQSRTLTFLTDNTQCDEIGALITMVITDSYQNGPTLRMRTDHRPQSSAARKQYKQFLLVAQDWNYHQANNLPSMTGVSDDNSLEKIEKDALNLEKYSYNTIFLKNILKKKSFSCFPPLIFFPFKNANLTNTH